MPRINPFTLRPASSSPISRTLTDDAQPGAEWSLTLQPPANYSVDFLIGDVEQSLVEKYIDGPGVLDPVMGVRPSMSKSLCRAIANLSVMHVPDEGDLPYTVDEWAALTVTWPSAFVEAWVWAEELRRRIKPDDSGEIDPKND